MADRRRRRRVRTSEDSEELSDGSEKDHSLEKESEEEHSELEKPAAESEYESAEEEDRPKDDKGGDKTSSEVEIQEQDAKESPLPLPVSNSVHVEEKIEVEAEVSNENAEETVSHDQLEESKDLVADELSNEIPEMHDFIEGESSGDLLDGEEGGVEEVADIEIECEFIENGDQLLVEEDDDDDDDVIEEEEYFEGERQQGDGEESTTPVPQKEKVLDDDEDRRNPQYIPKKGSFYEHDDRLGSEHEEEEDVKETKEKEKGKKKKLWLDEGRWGHDMYREEEQGPKPVEELVAVYGYDIRNEDNAPRARRRRRYGRGPNKYTRNWQDEDAYSKVGEQLPMRGRGPGRNAKNRQKQEDISTEDFPALPGKSTPPPPAVTQAEEDLTVVKTLTFQNSQLSRQQQQQQRGGVGRGRGSRRVERRPPGRGGGSGRGRRGRLPSEGEQRRHDDPSLEDAMEGLSVRSSQRDLDRPRPPRKDTSTQGAPPAEVVHKGGGESNRPKRYSSLRQRTLLENQGCYPSPPPSGQYYETAGYQPGALYGSGEGVASPTATPPVQPPMMSPFQGYTQPPYQETFAPPRLFTPVTAAPPVAYMAPPPPANLINYAPPPAPPAAVYQPYSFQQYRPPAPPPPLAPMAPPPDSATSSQQAELFRGGITYYNTHSQQHMGRHLPQRRPKAAIPILPPPPSSLSEDKDGSSSGSPNPVVEVES